MKIVRPYSQPFPAQQKIVRPYKQQVSDAIESEETDTTIRERIKSKDVLESESAVTMSQSEAISSLPTASATTISAIVKEKVLKFSKIMYNARNR